MIPFVSKKTRGSKGEGGVIFKPAVLFQFSSMRTFSKRKCVSWIRSCGWILRGRWCAWRIWSEGWANHSPPPDIYRPLWISLKILDSKDSIPAQGVRFLNKGSLGLQTMNEDCWTLLSCLILSPQHKDLPSITRALCFISYVHVKASFFVCWDICLFTFKLLCKKKLQLYLQCDLHY